MTTHWTPDQLADLSRAFQQSALLLAAAELDLFSHLDNAPQSAPQLADALATDPRATRILLDALAAIGLLVKDDDTYQPAPGVSETLTQNAPNTMLSMARHLAVCMRHWTQLAFVVKSGQRAGRTPGILGPEGELEAFIEAMNAISRHAAPPLVAAIGPPPFTHLLDVGGGPATWTIAFLNAAGPETQATLFDLPDVIPIARRHVEAAGLAGRVNFVGGRFDDDPALPRGADLAWVSAIIHMNSRDENRALFQKVHDALLAGGHILIRDVVLAESRLEPPAGALFAVNMLVNTPGGNAYTFDEIAHDLASAGFTHPRQIHADPFMSSVISAHRT